MAAPDSLSAAWVRAPSGVVAGVPLVAVILLLVVEAGGFDTVLFRFFNALPRYTGPALWAHVTILGDGLVAAVLLLPWVRRHPERVWGGLLGAVLMVIVLHTFKGLFSLPRPLAVLPEDTINLIGPGHRRSAFPSGHTATFFLYTGVWALTTRRRALSLVLLLPACLVGISRMAVGVHWPSDVLGGALLGWSMAWVGLRLGSRWSWGAGDTGRPILGAALLVSALFLLAMDHTGYSGTRLFQGFIAVFCFAVGARDVAMDLKGGRASGFPGPRMGD